MPALFIYFRTIKASWITIFIFLPIIAYVIQLRLVERPEIFSNILIVACLLLYLRAQKSFATKELIFISLLLLFWINYHSPIFGYIIIFGLFLEKAINKFFHKDNSFSWLFWCFWGSIIFLTGFMHHSGEHILISTIELATKGYAEYTQEYNASYETYSSNIVVHISWALSVYVGIWSLLKKQYGFVFIAILLTYASLSTSRLVTSTSLISLCIMALYFSQITLAQLTNIRSSLRTVFMATAVCTSLLALYYSVLEADLAVARKKHEAKFLQINYPQDMADYLINYQNDGNILNTMSAGGYLINKLSPNFKIYFDGRTHILYPIEFFIHHVNLLASTEELNRTIENDNIHYAIYRNKPELFLALNAAKNLDLILADDYYLLFAKEKVNAFPVTSKLLVFPSCWNDNLAQSIKEEINQSESLFPENKYTIQAALKLLELYLSHEDKQLFFDSLESNKPDSSNTVSRLALYLALYNDNIEAAAKIFSQLQTKNEYDILFYADFLANNNEPGAEDLLYLFFQSIKQNETKHAPLEKMAIVINILKSLENHNALDRYPRSLKISFEKQLRNQNQNPETILSFEHICL